MVSLMSHSSCAPTDDLGRGEAADRLDDAGQLAFAWTAATHCPLLTQGVMEPNAAVANPVITGENGGPVG
jgi:hypothetical protein